MQRMAHFINGRWTAPATPEAISVINPATERVIRTLLAGSASDVNLAAQAAADVFLAWSQTRVEQRAAILRKLARLIAAHADELTRTSVSEVGQPIRLAAALQTRGAFGNTLRMSPPLTISDAQVDHMLGAFDRAFARAG